MYFSNFPPLLLQNPSRIIIFINENGLLISQEIMTLRAGFQMYGYRRYRPYITLFKSICIFVRQKIAYYITITIGDFNAACREHIKQASGIICLSFESDRLLSRQHNRHSGNACAHTWSIIGKHNFITSRDIISIRVCARSYLHGRARSLASYS